jgi:hypothetical protein
MQAFARDLWDRGIIKDPMIYARMADVPIDELENVLDANVAKATRECLRMSIGIPELPEKFDNHAIHIAEHNRFRLSDSYRYADPEIRSIIDDHIMYHEHMAMQETAEQMLKEGMMPGLSKVPQGNEPVGSAVPPDYAEQMGQMAMMGPAPFNAPRGGGTPMV